MSALAALDVRNVFIYVADAVRWDHLPATIAERGAVQCTVAGSIHSPSSFATLLTGRHLPSHRVTSFESRLPTDLTTIFDMIDATGRFVNSIGRAGSDDPLVDVLNVADLTASDPFENLTEPFIVMERGQGGHAPYVEDDLTAPEYFETRKGDAPCRLRREYADGIVADSQHFLERLDRLDARDILEDTLVIYTSDHGELLGEGGLYGHNGPIRPELVYVPTVFIHPALSRGDAGFASGADLFRGIGDALGLDDAEMLPGVPPLAETRSSAPSFYETTHSFGRIPRRATSHYQSLWGPGGGHVFATTSLTTRLVGLAGQLFFHPASWFTRQSAASAAISHIRPDRTFAAPNFDRATAAEKLSSIRADGRTTERRIQLSSSDRQHLRDLGYVE